MQPMQQNVDEDGQSSQESTRVILFNGLCKLKDGLMNFMNDAMRYKSLVFESLY